MSRRKIITVYLNGIKFVEKESFAKTIYSVETCITTSPEPEMNINAAADIKNKMRLNNIFKHPSDFLNIDINKKQYCLSRR